MNVEKLHPIGFDPQTDAARWDKVKNLQFVLAGTEHMDNPLSGPADAKITGAFSTPDLPCAGASSELKPVPAPGKKPPPDNTAIAWFAEVVAGHVALNDFTKPPGDLGTQVVEAMDELGTPSPAGQLTFRWSGRLKAQSDAAPVVPFATAIQAAKDYPDTIGWAAIPTAGDLPDVLSQWLAGRMTRGDWGVTAEAAVNGSPNLVARLLTAPEMHVLLESDDCVDNPPSSPPNTRVHVISTDPAMPKLTVKTPILGLTKAENDAVVRSHTMTVKYGNSASWSKTIKQDNAGSEWTVDWGQGFFGGDINIEVTATLPWGEKIKGTTEGNHAIWGMNPSKAAVHAAYGDDAHYLASVWVESRFTQFSRSTSASTLNNFQSGPLTVLRAADNGYGIGQLTNPAPTHDQLWNWTSNVQASIALFETKKDAAQAAWNHVHAAHPEAPKWTDEELWLEIWNRYNGGAYWAWDSNHHVWKVGPVMHTRTVASSAMTTRSRVNTPLGGIDFSRSVRTSTVSPPFRLPSCSTDQWIPRSRPRSAVLPGLPTVLPSPGLTDEPQVTRLL